jgi:hypothetical protein
MIKAEFTQKYREGFISQGLCSYCGKNPPIDTEKPFSRCESCREKRHTYDLVNGNLQNHYSKENAKRGRTKRRSLVLDHYGRKCACCGEDQEIFLDLDHVNNDGKEHREKTGRAGSALYAWLIFNNFPTDYEIQVLCSNCNQGRRRNGGICPHQIAKAEDSE